MLLRVAKIEGSGGSDVGKFELRTELQDRDEPCDEPRDQSERSKIGPGSAGAANASRERPVLLTTRCFHPMVPIP